MKRDYNRVEAIIMYDTGAFAEVNCDYRHLRYVVPDRNYESIHERDEIGREIFSCTNGGFKRWTLYNTNNIDDLQPRMIIHKLRNDDISVWEFSNGQYNQIPNSELTIQNIYENNEWIGMSIKKNYDDSEMILAYKGNLL